MATSSEAFKSFKSLGPVVFIHSKNDSFSAWPKSVQKLRGGSEMGNTIPMVMVTTADLSTGLKGVGYKVLKEDTSRVAREMRREFKDTNVVGTAGGGQATEEKKEESTLLAQEQNWTNAEGVSIKAAVLSLEGDNVVFLMPDGKSVSYPLAKLSAASKETLEGLR